MTSKERCLATLRGQRTDRVPVFPLLMFFAQERAGISYREFATNGHAMAAAQLKVRERFGVDAITACTDAFRIAADLGGEMVFPEDHPPFLGRPLVRSQSDLRHLKRPDPSRPRSRMADRARGVREMAHAVGRECLVLGWVDMPFAEACAICGMTEFMVMIMDEPALAHSILKYLTDIVIDFCHIQIEAGAPMIGAGDAAASLIAPEQYREFALPYEQRICAAVHASGGITKLHICGNTAHLLGDMVKSGADLFNVDHMVDLILARETYRRAGACFKGNLNPVADMLQATPAQCAARAGDCLAKAAGTRFMLSAGCEVPARTSDEVFQAFCEAARNAQV